MNSVYSILFYTTCSSPTYWPWSGRKTGTEEPPPPLHDLSAKNTLDIILKLGIIIIIQTWKSIEFFHKICIKIQNIINAVTGVSAYSTCTISIWAHMSNEKNTHHTQYYSGTMCPLYVTRGTTEFIHNYTCWHTIIHNSKHLTFLSPVQGAQQAWEMSAGVSTLYTRK
jgi:hypothetical protein